MSFWQRFSSLFKPLQDSQTENDLSILLRDERARTASLEGVKEQLEVSLKMAQDNVAVLASVNKQLQAQIEGYIAKIGVLEATNKVLVQNLIDLKNQVSGLVVENIELRNQLANVPKPVEITPEWLTKYLLDKYPQGTDVSKTWDDWDLALINAFAVTQDDDPKIISAEEFKQTLVKAFPEAVFHSPAKDSQYFICKVDMAEKIVRNDYGNLMVYVPNRRDCDKFTQALRVHFWETYGYNNVVEVWGNTSFGYHSWVVIVCKEGIIEVEPQTDMISKLPNTLTGYSVGVIHDW